MGALDGIRVLDLGDERAAFATRILADLGADVVMVEPPGGGRIRGIAPFVDDEPGVERSYQHLYLDANKRSVVIDVAAESGRASLEALARNADVVVETAAPGALAALGLGYEQLSAARPGLIYVSITPFGQDGPWRDRAADDLVATAAGGLLAISGERDDPPTQGPCAPAYKLAGLAAAAGVMIALCRRERGAGEPDGASAHIDVALQEVVALSVMQSANANFWTQRRLFPERPGLSNGIRCADGKYLGLNIRLDQFADFIALLDRAGVEHRMTVDDWQTPSRNLNPLDNAHYDHARELAARFPRDELVHLLLEAGQVTMPMLDLHDMSDATHYRETDQFINVPHEPLDRTLSFPRSPVDAVAPGIAIRRAPLLGEHTAEVLAERSRPARAADRAAAPPAARLVARPLAGMRVVDFTWVLAGPLGTRMLASFGAEVIKVESRARIDPLRNAPLADGTRDVNLPGLFNAVNTGKRSLTLDLRDERARELVRRLIAQSDVVIDNYTNGALARMGFDFAALRADNPGLVMVHMPGCGDRGPWSDRRTLGNLLMAASGLNSLMGFEGRPLRGLGIAYPDFIAPNLQVICALAALRERARDGRGRELHLSQLSGTVSLIGAEWMRYRHTGAVPPRPGNREPNHAPHGVYRARGDDQWCAIAVRPEQWRAFCEAIGAPALAADPRFATHDARRAHEDALDALVEAWTATRDPWASADRLQASGIAAAAVERLPDMLDRDPQLARHFQRLHQPSAPELAITVDAEAVRFAGESDVLERAPLFGEHNEYVLRDLLGLSHAEFDALVLDGVIG